MVCTALHYSKEDEIEEVKQMTEEFLENEGRRPRILMAKMGQDGHDRGAKVVSYRLCRS